MKQLGVLPHRQQSYRLPIKRNEFILACRKHTLGDEPWVAEPLRGRVKGHCHHHSCVIDISQFNNLLWLLRVTAYVLRFLKNLKARLSPDDEQLLLGSEIGAKDMEEVGQYWILDVQKSLQQNKKFENWRREFNLFTDRNGVLRCRGRLSHADLTYLAKHPILVIANPFCNTGHYELSQQCNAWWS